MQSSPVILLAVVCGFFLIILAMVAFVIYAARKEAEKKTKVAQALGLRSTQDFQQLFQRLIFLNDITRPEVYRLESVFHRHDAQGGDVYLFSLLFRSRTRSNGGGRSRRSHTLEDDALAFISPAFNLPRFKVLPRLGGEGKFVDLANNLAGSAMEIKHDLIKFPHIPKLDDNYFIATPEVPASQVRLPDGFLRILASHPNLKLNAGGDAMTISYVNVEGNLPDEQKMMALYKVGIQLTREIQGV